MAAEDEITLEKFGGDVLGATGEGLPTLYERIAQARGKHLVVVSALRGVTDALARYSKTRDDTVLQNDVVFPHRVTGSERYPEEERALSMFIKSAAVMSAAEIMGLGEVLSTNLVASYLARKGVDVGKVDYFAPGSESSRDVLRANPDFPVRALQFRPQDADPDLDASRGMARVVRELLERHDVVVAPGFVARYHDGRAVTLGRGGSDTSILVYAYSLGLKKVTLWKAVEGVRSANPDIVPSHRLVRHLTAMEGLNLTLFGGDIVNFKAMQIAAEQEISIDVRYVRDPKILTTIGGPKDASSDDMPIKYVGGVKDAVLMHFDYETAVTRINRFVERNLGDFVHIFGPALNPTVVMLDARKHREIVDEEGWKYGDAMNVAAVGIVGEGSGEMKGALSEAARVISDAGIVVRGNVAATRGGTAGGYMAFFVDPQHFEKVVRLEHERFVEGK